MRDPQLEPEGDACHIPTITLNDGVQMPALGFGVFQTPPEETSALSRRRLPSVTGTSTLQLPMAMSARSARAFAARHRPQRRLHRDEGLDQRLRLRRDAPRIREERGQAGRRADRPADPAPAAADRVRPDARGLPGARDVARRRQGARDRRQQLHARAPRVAAGASLGRSCREPDRVHPYFQQTATRSAARRARDRHAGVVADRRHHVLPRGLAEADLRRPDHPRHRRRARQDSCAGDAALAPPGGPLRDPEVGQPERIAENFDVFDFELSDAEIAAIDAPRHRRRGGPEPADVTLESFGRPIPEA